MDIEKFRFHWEDFPALTQTAGTGGVIRQELEDFKVAELPLYLPQGSGSYAYAYIEKRGLTTRDVVLQLMRSGLKEQDIGVAGLKDKYAITRQWFSVPNRHAAVLEKLDDCQGIQVLELSRHKNKLGIGHLQGNSFEVRVRATEADACDNAEKTLEVLAQSGVPNYFGPQRFGRFANNAVDGLKLIQGENVPGGIRLKRFFISSVQSLLFNHLLAERIKDQLFDQVILGDWAKKHDTGGVFKVEDVTETLRAERFEISATLPLYGKKVRLSDALAGEREQAGLDYYGLRWLDFSSRKGDRRYSRIRLQAVSLHPQEDGYTVCFSLPRGAFASNVLRELTKTAVDDAKENVEADDMSA